jgi:hypothetical protein
MRSPSSGIAALAQRVVKVLADNRTRQLDLATLAVQACRCGLCGFLAGSIKVNEQMHDCCHRQRRQHDRAHAAGAYCRPARHPRRLHVAERCLDALADREFGGDDRRQLDRAA